MRIIIFGAGRVGMNLLKLLEPAHMDVVIVDSGRDTCEHLAAEYNAIVVCGDCTDPEILEELRLHDTDYVFAITGEEETNFLTSMYAKNAGAKHVIARCSSMKHSFLMEKLGIGVMVPEITLAQELSNRVLNPTIFKMLSPEEGNVDLFEVPIPDKVRGKRVRDVFKDKDITLLAVYDGKEFILPHEDDAIDGKRAVIVSTSGRKNVW
jgi:trk system potassium uptake protein TrkA